MRRSAEEIARAFGARVTGPLEWPDAIYPQHMAPVIIAPEGDRRLGLMRWGWPGPPGVRNEVTNARNLDSPFWHASVGVVAAARAQRC